MQERRELLRKNIGAGSPQSFLEEDYDRTRGMEDADRMQEIDLRHWLPGDILRKADCMSMAHSLEIRVPFLDREVFAVSCRLPAHMKQRGRVTKYILRRAFSGAAAKEYFHQEKLEKLLEEHLKKRKDNSRKLWTVYAFCIWYEIYFCGNDFEKRAAV